MLRYRSYLAAAFIVTCLLALVSQSCDAAETVTKGYVNTTPINLKSTTTGTTTTTKGYIGNDYVRLQSTTPGTTKGYINGKPVRIKVRKD